MTPTLHLAPVPDGLRAEVDLPIAAGVTTLVGPNAAGKSDVLEAVVVCLDRSDGVVVHAPAHRTPVQLVREVLDGIETVHAAGAAGPSGRTGDPERALVALFLDEARRVVPEVTRVDVDLEAGIVAARDRHGQRFSASSGLRSSLAMALVRLASEQGTPVRALLVEEPGAFLHPAAQEDLRDRLREVAGLVEGPTVITSETPFVIPRGPDDLVVALARDVDGEPMVVGTAAGDDPQASLIGGLFRDPGLGGVLDRAARLGVGTRAVLVVEGGTDEAYLRLAADALDRAAELEGVAILPAGGASAAVLQAVVLKHETDLPLLVLLDNDDPGRSARDTLVKRLSFTKREQVTTYAEVLPGYPPGTEAEDLFDHRFVARFAAEFGSEGVTGTRVLVGEHVHHDLTSSAKSAFVGWAREHARPEDLPGWTAVLDLLAERLR